MIVHVMIYGIRNAPATYPATLKFSGHGFSPSDEFQFFDDDFIFDRPCDSLYSFQARREITKGGFLVAVTAVLFAVVPLEDDKNRFVIIVVILMIVVVVVVVVVVDVRLFFVADNSQYYLLARRVRGNYLCVPIIKVN